MMTIKSLALSLALLSATTNAKEWRTCEFAKVNWLALDEGVGKSASYSVATMNGDMYTGGYMKGTFALMGITGATTPNVAPADGAAIWGKSDSDVQSLYIAKNDAHGSMVQSWFFQGEAIQRGSIGHDGGENNIATGGGLRAMLDNKHLAVNSEYRVKLTLPDGTVYTQGESNSNAKNPNDQVPVVMKLDTTSINGTGAGTTGWSKPMDGNCPGGAAVHSVDGDMAGNMIVSYECCQDYDSLLCPVDWKGDCSTDRYGTPYTCNSPSLAPPNQNDVECGRRLQCKQHITKLKAENGDPIWDKETSAALHDCTSDEDGDIFCGFTVRAQPMEATASWPFGTYTITTTNTSKDTIGIVVYDGSTGDVDAAQKLTGFAKSTQFSDLDVSPDGQILAVAGGCGRGCPAVLTRINTTTGAMMWQDSGGLGTHGFRQVAVNNDQIVAFGQVTTEGTGGELTLQDSAGNEMNIRTAGSYDVFVSAYNPEGVGEWAMDGGGTGLEYFFGLAIAKNTNTLYVSGYTRSPQIAWGGVEYVNPLHENGGADDTAAGSNKALTTQMTWGVGTTPGDGFLPSCLNGCTPANGVVEANIKNDNCFIDRRCYSKDTSSHYAGLECFKCAPTVSKQEWDFENPDTSNHCVIQQIGRTGSPIGKECVPNHEHKPAGRGAVDHCLACNVTASTTAYSDVPGCKLNVANFPGPPSSPGRAAPYSEITVPMASAAFEPLCYHSDGSPTNMTSKQCEDEHSDLQVCNAKEAEWPASQCQADHNALQACNAKDCMDTTVAIALIVVVSVTLGLVLVMLAVVVSKERSGNPLFAPLNSGPPQSQSAGSNTKDNF